MGRRLDHENHQFDVFGTDYGSSNGDRIVNLRFLNNGDGETRKQNKGDEEVLEAVEIGADL